MNALGDRCRAVVILVHTAEFNTALLDDRYGYHVGCLVSSSSTTARSTAPPSSEDIKEEFCRFCAAHTVHSQTCCWGDAAVAESIQRAMEVGTPATEYFSTTAAAPLTLLDCTALRSEALARSLLLWLYGASTSPVTWSGKSEDSRYTLVAVVDVARGTLFDPLATSAASGDVYAWLRPTPSFLSEWEDRHPSGCTSDLFLYPVHMFSRFPVLRDRGLQEVLHKGSAGERVPLATWTNKSTLTALLRELAFKAGQLAKYGA